MMMINAMRR